MNRALRVILRLVLSGVCWAAAESCSETHPRIGRDAQVDARVRDVDFIRSDAATPLPENGSASDMGTADAALSRDDAAQWERMTSLGQYCIVERARNPRAVLRVIWVPCLSALPGCTELAPDEAFSLRNFDIPEAASVDRSHHVFGVLQGNRISNPDLGYPRTVVLADTDGRVYGAWRDDVNRTAYDRYGFSHLCGLNEPAVRNGIASINIDEYVDHPTVHIQPSTYYQAPLEQIGQTDTPIWNATEQVARGSIAWIRASGTMTVGFLGVSGYLNLVSPERAVLRGVEMPGDVSDLTDAYGPYAFWMAGGYSGENDAALAVSSIERGDWILRSEPGRVLRDLMTDGTWLTWIRGTGLDRSGRYAFGELFVAPFTVESDALRPRIVRTNVPTGHLEIGDGLIAYQRLAEGTSGLTSSIEVVDAMTGVTRGVTLRLPDRFFHPLYVAREEVLVSAVVDNRSRLMRLRPESMPVLTSGGEGPPDGGVDAAAVMPEGGR